MIIPFHLEASMRRTVLLIALAAALAACGGSGGTTPTVDTGPASGPDGEVTTTTAREEVPPGTAGSGDAVSVHYVGTLDDGTEFDSSRDRGPLSFVIDDGTMIRGFNDTVVGMAIGETRTVTLAPDDAYGPYLEELVIEVPLEQLPADVAPGDELISPTGQIVVVVAVNEEFAVIDANHHLAGKALTFQLTLVSIG